MSTLYVDTVTEKTSGNGVQIAGHVVQVKSLGITTGASASTSSFTNLTSENITITPLNANSKILVLLHVEVANSGGANNDNENAYRIVRDISGGSSDVQIQLNHHRTYDYGASGVYQHTSGNWMVLDSPSTASQITYKLQGKVVTNANAEILSIPSAGDCWTVMEIAQ